jgi:N-acyl-phosphatidylethanolamine-hydrolysing phospholipase D
LIICRRISERRQKPFQLEILYSIEPMNNPASVALPSEHYNQGGGFRNPWPLSQPHGFRDLLKWMLSRRRQATEGYLPLFTTVIQAVPDPGDAGLAITWIGHSTFLIRAHGACVLTDPIWSNRASPVRFSGPRRLTPPGLPFDNLPSVDAVFISHDHYDHLDDRTVRRLVSRFPHARWIGPLGIGDFLEKRGAAHVVESDWWQARDLGVISASCTPAQHFSGRYPWNRNATLWCGWVIGIGGYRVFFAGDTGLHPEFGEIARRFGPIDAAILPIGAYEPRWFMQPVHMNPEDAVSAYLQIVRSSPSSDACLFVPSHWGTFRLTDEPLDEPPRFLRKAWIKEDLPENRLSLLQPGETICQN